MCHLELPPPQTFHLLSRRQPQLAFCVTVGPARNQSTFDSLVCSLMKFQSSSTAQINSLSESDIDCAPPKYPNLHIHTSPDLQKAQLQKCQNQHMKIVKTQRLLTASGTAYSVLEAQGQSHAVLSSTVEGLKQTFDPNPWPGFSA
jgi:hypothetical protein